MNQLGFSVVIHLKLLHLGGQLTPGTCAVAVRTLLAPNTTRPGVESGFLFHLVIVQAKGKKCPEHKRLDKCCRLVSCQQESWNTKPETASRTFFFFFFPFLFLVRALETQQLTRSLPVLNASNRLLVSFFICEWRFGDYPSTSRHQKPYGQRDDCSQSRSCRKQWIYMDKSQQIFLCRGTACS